MAPTETASTRLPRGTKVVQQAFFTALYGVADAQRPAVAKAALATIRDQLRSEQVKANEASLKQKMRKPLATKPPAKAAALKANRTTVMKAPARHSSKRG